ncbi:MAG: hypothetical protein BWX60_01015 [Candidatus Marinimicrobia bacterium ADurb.Bin030]|nr:MAG: hypothetical protein BWX60_01015 [Candidatus Marinimicrobia bacterium ADurb.Bin030]
MTGNKQFRQSYFLIGNSLVAFFNHPTGFKAAWVVGIIGDELFKGGFGGYKIISLIESLGFVTSTPTSAEIRIECQRNPHSIKINLLNRAYVMRVFQITEITDCVSDFYAVTFF